MTVKKEDRDIVERMFKAMQTGVPAQKEMMALFADNAVFTEPFSGEPRTHKGKAEIRACFIDMWNEPDPDMELTVGRVDMDGDMVRAEWTCTSPVFAAPMHGHDVFCIKDGLIQNLEVVVTDMPPMNLDEGDENQ